MKSLRLEGLPGREVQAQGTAEPQSVLGTLARRLPVGDRLREWGDHGGPTESPHRGWRESEAP